MAFQNLPLELQRLNQWLGWRYEETDGGKPTKVPVNIRTGWPASVTDPQAWCPFDNAVTAATNGGLAGIGFVFTDHDEYCGIDLDTPHDPLTGESLLSPEDGARQQLIFQKMDSYSELSPSGRGLHIIVKAKVPHGRKRQGVEVYSSGRFFTMTGNVYHNAPIADRQELVQLLWSEMGAQAQPNYYAGDFTEHYPDQDIWDQAAKARNGDLFLRLWNGDTSGYFSASEADFALIDIIAFYTKNRMQITRMFMASALGKRDKYANAKPGRLSTLLGYMVNKSFDRMLPPVDMAGVIDQFNAALAATRGPTPPVADLPGTGLPRPTGGADFLSATPSPSSSSYDGMATDLWRTLPPNGLLGELASYIYDASPRPVYEVSLAAALGLLSGVCGRAFNVSGTGLNHYIMLLAATGAGKEAMASGISRLSSIVAKQIPSIMQFVGPAEIASGQALLKHLSDRETPCFVSLVGEIGLRLQQMTHPNATSSDIALRRVMLDLFGKSGAGETVRPTIYSDKKNNTDVINSPSFSLLGDSTPETFYRALDEDAIVQGLLPRFTIIEYTGHRVPLNMERANVVPSDSLVTQMADLAKACHDNMALGAITNVLFTPDAWQMFRDMDTYSTAKINASDRDVFKQLWNRFDLKVIKLAAILALSVNRFNPVINVQQMEWARSLVLTDTLRLLGKFQAGLIGTHNENTEQDAGIKQAIRQYLASEYVELTTYEINGALHQDKIIPYFYLQRRLVATAPYKKGKVTGTQAVKAAIQNLIDAGQLQEVPPAQLREKYQFNGRAYVANNPIWFLK